jgi:ATP-dependent exoDNAse (exonuclease V) alpha subunit
MSKKVQRDEKGHPILPGGKTFGNIITSKNNHSSRTSDLKDRASQRILLLLKKGQQADRLARKVNPIKEQQQIAALALQNEFAMSPKIVQFAFHRSKLASLRVELEELLESKNERKIKFSEVTIKKEIHETEEKMRELFDEIKMERRVVSE